MAVGTGVEEEDENDRGSPVRGQLEGRIAVQHLSPEEGGRRVASQHGLRAVALSGKAQVLPDLVLDQLRCVLVRGELQDAECDVPLGVDPHQRQGASHAQASRDRSGRVVEYREVDAVLAREVCGPFSGRRPRDAEDLEVVLAPERRHVHDRTGDVRGVGVVRVEEVDQQALSNQGGDRKLLLVEGPARKGGEGALLARGASGRSRRRSRVGRCRRFCRCGFGRVGAASIGRASRGSRLALSAAAGDPGRGCQGERESPNAHELQHKNRALAGQPVRPRGSGTGSYPTFWRMWMPQALPSPMTWVRPTVAPST